MPERPLMTLSQAVLTSLATGETIPRPVMTTRRFTEDSSRRPRPQRKIRFDNRGPTPRGGHRRPFAAGATAARAGRTRTEPGVADNATHGRAAAGRAAGLPGPPRCYFLRLALM